MLLTPEGLQQSRASLEGVVARNMSMVSSDEVIEGVHALPGLPSLEPLAAPT
jgi:hypothetical protein